MINGVCLGENKAAINALHPPGRRGQAIEEKEGGDVCHVRLK